MVYLNNKYCLSFQKFTMKYPQSILLDTRWCAGIEYCAVKAHLLTYTIFFYFTAFQAYDPAILRMIRLPLVAAGLAVPFWIIIHNYAAAQADFPGPLPASLHRDSHMQ
jgi:hypothetical protein